MSRKRSLSRCSNAVHRQKLARLSESEDDHQLRLSDQRARQHHLRAERQPPRERKQHQKLGVITDTDYFNEGDFSPSQCHHELPTLFISGNVCQFCNAHRWKEERKGFCCENGKVKLPSQPALPHQMQEIYRVHRQTLLPNLRSYNNALALASLGCSEQSMPGFSPTFKIQGKVYHRFGSLLPRTGEPPKFAQIYFHDTEHELQNRLHHNSHLHPDILTALQTCLHRVNPYVHSFKSAIEFAANHPEAKLVLNAEKKPTSEHPRSYNLPTGSEVAVIMPGEQGYDTDVIIQTRSGHIHTITSIHRSYDPLHYILLFPHGTDGYTVKIPHAFGSGHISPTQFYKYKLQIRSNTDNSIMKSRRLTQQYATDAFAKAESQRLKWIRNNQSTIRAEKYKGLLDAVNDSDELRAGMRVILPPTFYGSPRWYAEAFQDAMAIVRKFGKPDFFITFTCNPRWPEIKASLFDGEHPSDRPDICVRVFNIKLQSLLHDLVKNHALGKVKAYTAMKEDQKRGLPHCHILLIMHDADKPRTPTYINKIVSAEIPDPVVNPKLHAIVTRNMIHGPCGQVNPNSPCMDTTSCGKVCQKQFPREFIQHTVLANATYPHYRRRSQQHGGRTHLLKVQGQNFTVDNRWIVPYSPFLSLKYNAHINVEVVISVSCVKYLYKYTCKGSDKVMVRLANGDEKNITNDEIERYVTARYVSASEAYWRLYEFKILMKYPPVMKLPLHLEDEQTVLFHPHQAEEVANKPPPRTKLTAYFELNATNPLARSILYPDICSQYIWKGSRWVKRSRKAAKPHEGHGTGVQWSDMIGRIPVISLSPRQSELYYMRMLLHHKPGATSFADLHKIDGNEEETFAAACMKLGLLEDDTEIDKVMQEAALVKFGPQLREVFATILIWTQPSDPMAFWNRHLNLLTEDLLHQLNVQTPSDHIINQVLFEIQQHVERNGYVMEDMNIPKPDPNFVRDMGPRELCEETNYNIQELEQLLHKNVPLMNTEQLEVYNRTIDSINNDRGLLIALDAPGGTGKTFVLTTILAKVRTMKKIALATATSGIAATLLPNGRTLHSRCKIPIETLSDTSYCNISKRDTTAEILRRCSLLIVDEVTMANRKVYEAVERTFKDIRENQRTFGGITVIFSGDWRQILPVVRRGSRPEIIDACLKTSPLWQEFTIMNLIINMRVQLSGGDSYADTLLSIGEGRIPVEKELGEHKIRLDTDMLIAEENLNKLCDFVFDSLDKDYDSPHWLCSRGILCPTNQAADDINAIMMDRFPGQPRKYISSDKLINCENHHQYPVEFLNTISTGMPPHILSLKQNCPIMLLRNLDPTNGHCNGTRYVINNMHDHVIEATVAMGVHAGKQIFIPRIPISPSDTTLPFKMQRRQFPVKPSFAMTANKSQGQTLSKVGLYLSKDFFSHGQLYVAMSRVGDKQNIKILSKNGQFPGKHGFFTDNVVYQEILR